MLSIKENQMKAIFIKSSILQANSTSNVLVEKAKEIWVAKGHTVLAEKDLAANPLPYLTLDNISSQLSKDLIEELRQTDYLIVGAPLYNFGVPAQLKVYIDHIAKAGETFKYEATGPVGLLKGKKAIVITTTGGYYTDTPIAGMDHSSNYLKDVLSFLGFEVTVVSSEGIAINKEKALQEAIEKVNQVI